MENFSKRLSGALRPAPKPPSGGNPIDFSLPARSPPSPPVQSNSPPPLSNSVKAARNASLQRAYSTKSTIAIDNLSKADFELSKAEEEAHLLKGRFDFAMNELIAVKNRVALMSGEVEKLQNKSIDTIVTQELVSGKDDAKAERKELNRRAEVLHGALQRLHSGCAASLSQQGHLQSEEFNF